MLVEITRARRPLTALIAGAALFGLGSALTGVAYAILTADNIRATRDLGTAADWLVFVAVASGLAAVAMTAWWTLVIQGWQQAVELLAAAASSLLIVIGSLVVAANSPDGSAGGSIVTAVGVGGWMLLALIVAARRAIVEQGGLAGRTSELWLIASGSLLILAVATGLPSPGSKGRALPIAESVLFMVGFAGLAATFELAARRGHISSGRIRILNAGLAAMAVAYLAAAIADGFVFAPSAGLTTVRVGLCIPAFLTAIAWAVIALAAFWRLADLMGPVATAAPTGVEAAPASQPTDYPAPAGGFPSPAAGFPSPPPPPPPGAPSRWSLRRPRPVVGERAPTAKQTGPDSPGPVPTAGTEAPAPPGAADPEPPAGPAAAVADPTLVWPASAAADPAPTEMLHCGMPLPPGATSCPRCGQPV